MSFTSPAFWVLRPVAFQRVTTHDSALLEAALYHSKRAYGCTGTIFPPRPLVVKNDVARPCRGADGAGGWSLRGLLLDAEGVVRWFHDQGYSALKLKLLEGALSEVQPPPVTATANEP